MDHELQNVEISYLTITNSVAYYFEMSSLGEEIKS